MCQCSTSTFDALRCECTVLDMPVSRRRRRHHLEVNSSCNGFHAMITDGVVVIICPFIIFLAALLKMATLNRRRRLAVVCLYETRHVSPCSPLVCLSAWPAILCVHCCFTSTETIRTSTHGEPRTATSTFTQLLCSEFSLAFTQFKEKTVTGLPYPSPMTRKRFLWTLSPNNQSETIVQPPDGRIL